MSRNADFVDERSSDLAIVQPLATQPSRGSSGPVIRRCETTFWHVARWLDVLATMLAPGWEIEIQVASRAVTRGCR